MAEKAHPNDLGETENVFKLEQNYKEKEKNDANNHTKWKLFQILQSSGTKNYTNSICRNYEN